MKRLLVLLALVASGIATAAPLPNEAALSWQPIAQNCNGSGLNIADVTAFRIFYGRVGRVAAGLPATSTGACNDPSQVAFGNAKIAAAYAQTIDVPAGVSVKTIAFTTPGKYYFAVAGMGARGNSNLSNEVSKTIVVGPPPVAVLSNAVCVIAANCTKSPSPVTLLLGDTSQDVTISWPAVAGADQIFVELYPYPVKAGAIATAKATLAGSAVSWSFHAGRASLFYTRMQTCSAGNCGAWANSFDQGWLYYFKLAPPIIN